jgi:hypothetical protein
MNTIAEIEIAIERLPISQVDELAAWIEELRLRRSAEPQIEAWLEHARGAAQPGVSTDDVLQKTRGVRTSPSSR